MTTKLRRRGASRASDEIIAEERQEVVQVLLNRPFIYRQKDTELYMLARDHFAVLRDWFYEQTGWSLYFTRQFVKLEKTPGQWQPWMAIEGFRDGRDYGYFTLGLWYLEGLGERDQFLLSEMVDAIREHLVTAGIYVDWTLYEHRMAMARALKKLRDLGALHTVEGDETQWARAGAEEDVLYESSQLARYLLQRLPRDIMSYVSVDELNSLGNQEAGEEASMDTPSAQADEVMGTAERDRPDLLGTHSQGPSTTIRRRWQVMRRLLQEPVVYDWQWTDEERRYVQTQRASLIERIREFTGLEGRRFREGLIFFWPELTAQMDLFPTQAVLSDIVILLAAQFRRELGNSVHPYDTDEEGCFVLTQTEFEGLILNLRQNYSEWWSKEYREKTTVSLAADVIKHLELWNLGQSYENGSIVLYPALSRWSGEYQNGENQSNEYQGGDYQSEGGS